MTVLGGKTWEQRYGIVVATKLKLDWKNRPGTFVGKTHSIETRQKLREIAYKRKPKYKNTQPELVLKKLLREKNIQFDDDKRIYGSPDIFIEPNICIFVDGEYWHKYPNLRPKDHQVNQFLQSQKYIVLRFWAKREINKTPEQVITKILQNIIKPV